LSIQAKLLRFLESGECLAVGEVKPYKVDVRIISATNTDLNKQIKAGEFRSDLYFRLNVVPLELPPLAQRTEDIDLLIKHFLDIFQNAHALAAPRFSKQALKTLKAYSWPGNIRELRNVCERLSILLAGKVIEPENLPFEFTAQKVGNAPATTDFTLPEAGLKLDTLEADLISQALDRTNGNRSKSARLLGISRDTLLYRMQKHGFAM
jgi:DNA-binding NtrC family response regulator